MSWAAVVVGGGALIGGALSADSQRSAGNKAADSQERAAQLQVDEYARQFDSIQKLLSPFVTGGTSAFGAQGDLLGLNGADKQRAAIAGIESGPQFSSLMRQGENAILANASATGGLRGGNTQAALAEFRPQLLNQLINDQFQKLGGLSSVGQNAAAGVGNAGMAAASGMSNAFGQMGAAGAGRALSAGAANSQLINGAMGAFGQMLGGYFGSGSSGFTGQNGFTSVDYGIGGGGF